MINTRITVTNNCYVVLCCLFSTISGSNYGGAISVGGTGSCLKCESCKFFKVSSIQYHAAIYCDVYSTNSSVEKSDISYCSSPEYSGISLFSSTSLMSHVSAYLCHENAGVCANVVLIHIYGIQESNNINTSRTNANHHCGHNFHSAIDVKTSRFFNVANHRNTEFVFGMYQVPSNVILSYSNIVNNTVSWALVYLNKLGSVKVSNFVFSSNIGPLTCNRGILTGKGEFIGCVYDTASVNNGNGVITQINPVYNQNSATTYMIYEYQNYNCNPFSNHKMKIPRLLNSFVFVPLMI